jgi:hypothetical protein
MDSKHTPGPWIADSAGYGGWRFDGGYNGVIRTLDGFHVFAGPSSFLALRGRDAAEADANARLIAAAPELLEALQYVMSAHGEQLHDAFDAAEKAIAKATAVTP